MRQDNQMKEMLVNLQPQQLHDHEAINPEHHLLLS